MFLNYIRIAMREYKQTVEFANFVCHFGGQELLAYLDEIIIPAFTRGPRVRTWGNSKYLLHDVRLVDLQRIPGATSEPAIVGRLVLDTDLRRDQILENGSLVASPHSIKSAPSSLFVLILRSHKLLYAKQVSGAPGISAFRTTIEILLKQSRKEYLENVYLAAKEAEQKAGVSRKISRRMIYEVIEAPKVEIVYLSGTNSLRDFVNQFALLKEVRIKVVKPNNEINNDKIFADVQKIREKIGAESTSLTHRNSTGLEKAAALAHIIPAIDGNAEINLSGTGADNQKLSGNNEDFKVVEFVKLPNDPVQGAIMLFDAFARAVRTKVLTVAKTIVSAENEKKLKRLLND